jgi:urease accessory protein
MSDKMPRACTILQPGAARGEIADTLLLTFNDRCRQQGFAFGGKGTCVEFDFPSPPRLRTDDVVVLDDGRLVEIVAEAEPVLELRAKDFSALARLILALGNRHVPVEVLTNRVRVLPTAETQALITAYGLAPVSVTAPFDPEDETRHEHHHDHHHEHDGKEAHGHEHRHAQQHEHAPGHAHGHEHRHQVGHAHEYEHGHGQRTKFPPAPKGQV